MAARAKRIKCINLETGKSALFAENFLKMQPRPYISDTGKYYENGVWALDSQVVSPAAEKIIKAADKPGAWPPPAPKPVDEVADEGAE